MKVFVTGSTGLLGNNLVRELIAAGHDVVGLTRTRDKAQWLLGDTSAQFVVGDIRQIDGFADALEGCDAVIHTAAYFREYYAPGDHTEALEQINVEGTLGLMREADRRGVARFIHTSSAGTIGEKPDGRPGDEDTPPSQMQLRNLYFKSKFDGDAKIRAFTPASGMRIVEILPGWMWGPGDAGPTGAGKLVLEFLDGKLPAVPAGGTNTVDARDVAKAIVAALAHDDPRDRYIVAGEHYYLHALMQLVGAQADKRPPRKLPKWMALAYGYASETWARLTGGTPTAPLEGVRVMADVHHVSSQRAIEDLGARFRPFEQTVRDVLAWYGEHGTYEASARAEASAATAA